MGNKLKHIHWVRVIGNDNALAERYERHLKRREERTMCDAIITRRRDEATANIQMRIMRNLVNYVNDEVSDDIKDDILRYIECLPFDWRELVETLNVE